MKELIIGHLSTAYHTNFILNNIENIENSLNTRIKWIMFGTGPLMIKAFLKNKIHAGYMGLPPAIIGINKGCPIKCVAGGHVEGTIMIASKNYNNIEKMNGNLEKTLKQFENKIIGVPSRGSIHDVILNYYLEKTNLINSIKVKNYKQPEFIAVDLKRNRIAAGVGTPALAVFAKSIMDAHLILKPEDIFKYNPSYGIFFLQKIISEEPELIQNFLSFHKNACFLLRENPLKAAEIISKTFKIAPIHYIESIIKISPKYCAALSEDYINTTMKFVKILYKLGYISKELSKQDIFNLEIIRKVHPEKAHY
ncbi:MAG: ABC transporter substrate-binding protein [Promethearchaeia archaeon]